MEAFTTIYTAYIRPILDYAVPVWYSHSVKHVKKLEKVQRFGTKLVPELRGMTYEERLEDLCPTTQTDKTKYDFKVKKK